MMREIYSREAKVIIWFGPEQPLDQEALVSSRGSSYGGHGELHLPYLYPSL